VEDRGGKKSPEKSEVNTSGFTHTGQRMNRRSRKMHVGPPEGEGPEA